MRHRFEQHCSITVLVTGTLADSFICIWVDSLCLKIPMSCKQEVCMIQIVIGGKEKPWIKNEIQAIVNQYQACQTDQTARSYHHYKGEWSYYGCC